MITGWEIHGVKDRVKEELEPILKAFG